jgi:response regulator of citrate/malate metabolism
MQNLNLSQQQLDNLLKIAGKKLGQDPEDLRARLENGELDQIIGGLKPETQSKIAELANNPKAVEALLGGGRLGEIIANFTNKRQQ